MKNFLWGVLLSLFISCNTNTPKPPERLPESELRAYRDAVSKLAEYIVLEDSTFYLNISKDKAIQKGVPEKYYKRIKEEIEFTNFTIADNNKKGITTDFDRCW